LAVEMASNSCVSSPFSFNGRLTSQESNQSGYDLGQHFVQILRTSDTPRTSLLELTRILGEIFQVDDCLIGIEDRNQTIVQTTYWNRGKATQFVQAPIPLPDILTHPLLKTVLVEEGHPPIVISDTNRYRDIGQGAKTFDSTEVHCFPIRSILAVKTLFQGAVNGVIVLTRSYPTNWAESDVELLKTLSNQVAIAISQEQLEQQMQQQIRYRMLLDQLTGAMRNGQDLEQIFDLAIEGLVSTLQVSRGFVLLLKYTNPLLQKRMGKHPSSAKVTVECEYPHACELPKSPHVNGDVATTPHAGTWLKYSFWASECGICKQMFVDWAEPVVIPALKQLVNAQVQPGDPTPDFYPAPIFNLEVMPSLLLIPLEQQGTVLGSLVFQHDRHRFWQPDEVAFVKLTAAQLSTAIIQTRTLRQVQSLVDERTAQLQRSLEVQAKLYEKTRQQVDQLRRLNQIMEEFLSTTSHELLTPLTSMTLAIRMLKQADLTTEQRARYLDILERQCVQETNLINDLLALRKLESGSTTIRFQPLDIRYPIRDVVQSFEPTWAKKDLKLNLSLPERPLKIYTDLESFTRILTELLANAGKYADCDTTVDLQLSYQHAHQMGQVVLTLTNIGAGITPEEMPYIFDKFRRGQGVTQQAIPGTGLGLALVKGLVEHLNGTITLSSTPLADGDSWITCFTLTLPQSSDVLVK